MIESSFSSSDIPETAALSGKHQKFVEAIASGLGNQQAYITAYPGAAPCTAKSQAWRLLARPDGQAVLACLRKRIGVRSHHDPPGLASISPSSFEPLLLKSLLTPT